MLCLCVSAHVWRLEDNFLCILFSHLPGPVLVFGDRVPCYSGRALTHRVPENDIDLLIFQLCFHRAGFRSGWPLGPAKVLREVDLCPHSELLSQLSESEELCPTGGRKIIPRSRLTCATY